MLALALAVCVIGLVNLAAFIAFWYDKHQAQTGGWRVSEASLLLLCFLGGAVGGKAAQRRFRHKTRKQPFARTLNLSLFANALCALLLVVPDGRAVMASAFASVAPDLSWSGPNDRSGLPRRFGPGSDDSP